MPYVFLSDQQVDPVEPVRSAGSVGWNISSTGLDFDDFFFSVVYFVFPVAFYFTIVAKEAVHVDDDGKLVVFITALLVTPALQTLLPGHVPCVTHRLTQWSPCGLQGRSVGLPCAADVAPAASRSMAP